MQLEDYFEIDTVESASLGKIEKIHLKGSRIGVEHIIEPYLQGESPERIWQGYRRSLTLEQVYATITWFLHNRAQVEEYLKRGEEIAEFYRREIGKKEPPKAIKSARALKAQRQATER